MNLTLTKISHSKSLSEETPAYTAVVCLDGKPVCHVSNHGTGGCDNQHWIDREAEKTITAWFASQPERDSGMELEGKPFMIQPDLEYWCQTELQVGEVLKSIKRNLAKKVIGAVDGKEYTFTIAPDRLTASRAVILAKYPGMEFLNDFTLERLTTYVRALVA